MEKSRPDIRTGDSIGLQPEDSTMAHSTLSLYRLAMDHAGNGIIITRRQDDDNLIIYANRAFCELTGYAHEDVMGRDCRFIQGTETNQDDVSRLREAIRKNEQISIVIRNFRKDGTGFWNELSLSPVPALPGTNDRYFIGVQIDVTDRIEGRRQLEAEVRQRTAQLQELNAELDQFATVASHDLQEPLRMISGYLDLLDDRFRSSLPKDGQEFLDYSREGAGRIRQMLGDLLAYARLERDNTSFRSVNLNAVVEEAKQNLRLQISETKARIDVAELPTINGESRQLVQLFQNLLANALTYRGTDTPVISIKAHGEGDFWRMTVTDNGRGFDPRYADKIFRVFQQLEHHGPESKSSGIGLAIAHKIVRRHGGRISAASARGSGSVFTITLPRNQEYTDDRAS